MTSYGRDGVKAVAVIGAGTIGLGWTTLFLAHGLDVRLVTSRPDAARAVREGVEQFARSLPGGPAEPGRLLDRLTTGDDIARAVADVDAVQENVREDLTLKRRVFASVQSAAPPHALLLSSSSSLSTDAMAAELKRPEGLMVGHPFNPAHLMPLVEIVPGERTDPTAVQAASRFYRALGKTPVTVRRPMAGTVANRLQSALLREAVHLVLEGIISVEEVDDVVTGSLGLRWSAVGPFQAFHLGGGPGGLQRMLAAIGPKMNAEWQHLGRPVLDDSTIDTLVAQAHKAFGTDSYPRLAAARDARQRAVLTALRDVDGVQGTGGGAGPGAAPEGAGAAEEEGP